MRGSLFEANTCILLCFVQTHTHARTYTHRHRHRHRHTHTQIPMHTHERARPRFLPTSCLTDSAEPEVVRCGDECRARTTSSAESCTMTAQKKKRRACRLVGNLAAHRALCLCVCVCVFACVCSCFVCVGGESARTQMREAKAGTSDKDASHQAVALALLQDTLLLWSRHIPSPKRRHLVGCCCCCKTRNRTQARKAKKEMAFPKKESISLFFPRFAQQTNKQHDGKQTEVPGGAG